MFLTRLKISVSISALIALLIGVLLTVLAFSAVRRIESERHQLAFRQEAMSRWMLLNEGVDDAVASLKSVNDLFVAVGEVDRQQFHAFVTPLLQRYPFIQAFNFHRLVAHAERSAFEQKMQVGYPGFHITESRDGEIVVAAVRPRYNVVDYLEPSLHNEGAFGFDAFSYGLQGTAFRRAVETGRPAATGLLHLVQEKDQQRGVIVIMPVYRHRDPLQSAGTPVRLVGDTAAVFRTGDLIGKIFAARSAPAAPQVEVSVYGDDTIDPAMRIFHSGAAQAESGNRWPPFGWLLYDVADSFSRPVEMAGTRWRIVVSDRPVPFTANGNGALYVLFGGAAISLLAAAWIYAMVSRAAKIERLVGERTAALNFANLRLSEDIALHTKTEKTLRLRERVIEASTNAIIITSASGPGYVIEYVNRAFTRITGYAAEDVIGRGLKLLQGDDQDQQNIQLIRDALEQRREGHAMLRTYRKDGSMYWTDLYVAPVADDAGDIGHFVIAQYDITESKRYEAELEFQATHDALTGAANRTLLRQRLGQAVAAAERDGRSIWVMFVDIDRFKLVNDTLGHPAGDRLLKVLADRLRTAASHDDTVARLGGDEFVFVVGSYSEATEVELTLERILAAIAQPLMIDEIEFVLTCSIGIAVCPGDSNDPDTLIRFADIAMYRAKELGRNNFQYYTPALNEHSQDRARLERDLRGALQRDEFVLHYQPQVDLRSGRITGMEALVRWQHPALGSLPPARFISLAEETGLILPLGAWVMRRACNDVVAWNVAGHDNLRVSVNLSARQFLQKNLIQSVADILAETGIAPGQLEIELTESLVMTDVEQAIAILHDFRKLGVTLSIDDFGTGYSSLSYLKRLPLNVLKIDRSFVRDITVDPDDAAIVISIISLAHSLRLHVIAEGVETAQQLAFLKAHDCDAMQGFFFSQAVTAEVFTLMLEAGQALQST